ncbi:MAG: relaxase/mobilization nuclease domain-containing protein [Prevotella sp.]|nr:relaxase/mobilization nuclease domain-containing protein [Prevotella sp.]
MAVPCVIKILGATATSFAAVDYNENKVAEGVAECVAMRNFGPLEQYNFHAADTMKKYLQKIADRNDRVQHPQLHIMVSYPGIPSEEEKTILLQNFKDTLDRLGYKDQPQAIWAHNDTDHFHFHAATVRVDQKTGRWINNSWEGVKARRILDQLRGIEHDRQLDKMLDYNYTSLNQFQHILRANGYHFHVDEENNNLEVYRACKNVGTVNIDEIKAKAEENMAKRKTDKEEQLKRLKQVRAVISKYRDKSLSAIVDIPETVKTKSGKVHTKTATKGKAKRARFQGSSGLELTELKKAQFKQFLIDLKRTAGLEILFHKGEDGKVKGYSIIDNSKGMIYNGSDIMKLSALLNGKGMTEEIIPADLAEEVNQEYRDERTAKRDNITPSNIYDIVQKKLKEFKLSWREPSFISAEAVSLSAEENCQKAIELISLAETQHTNGNWRWEVNAEIAAEHAYAAFVDDKILKETTATKTLNSQTYFEEKPKSLVPIPEGLNAFNVVDYMKKELKKLGVQIPHMNVGVDAFLSKTEQEYIQMSIDSLQHAKESENKSEAVEAYKFALAAEECRRRQQSKEQTTVQTIKPKSAVKPVVPKIRTISFTGFTASVSTKDGKSYITATVAGKNMEKPLSAGHNAWYQQEQDKTEAARGLALHYFSQEFYIAKREEYKQQCIGNGKMPYGIKVSGVKQYASNIFGRVDYPNGDWDANVSHKASVKDYKPNEKEKDFFIRKFGSEEADNFWGHTFKDIKDFFIDKPAEFENSKAIDETLGVFAEIAAAFNDSMATMFNVVLGNNAGYVPSCGGGGNNNLPKKKDDDWLKNPRSLFMKPVKGKSLRR